MYIKQYKRNVNAAIPKALNEVYFAASSTQSLLSNTRKDVTPRMMEYMNLRTEPNAHGNDRSSAAIDNLIPNTRSANIDFEYGCFALFLQGATEKYQIMKKA